MLNYQRVNQVKDFNQEGFYLQALTRIGNYINSKKRDVKEHITEDAMNQNIGFFSNQQRTSNKTGTSMAQHDMAQFDFKDFLQ